MFSLLTRVAGMLITVVGKSGGVLKHVVGKSTGVLKNVMGKYNSWLKTAAWKASIISSTILSGVGDYICQIFIEKPSIDTFVPDFKRTAKMMMHGTFIAGPVLNAMYRYINPFYMTKIIPRILPW